MKRDLNNLDRKTYDLLVIGGGIYGVCVAWDAALRGLSVALVEKGDFGHATSFNTMRIFHGGFRYLQSGDIRRARQSLYEQMIFMKIAPHLVHPLPFIIPTYGHLFRGKEMLSLALRIYNLIGIDIKPLRDSEDLLPEGKIISREECLKILPGIETNGLTGGIVFFDCQMSSSERVIISIAHSAAESGADLANYLEVIGFLKYQNRIAGVKVKDVLSGEEFDILAKVVVNTSGPWLHNVLRSLSYRSSKVYHGLSKAFNLLINRKITTKYAVGMYSNRLDNNTSQLLGKRSRYLFITPWRDSCLIGTAHILGEADPNNIWLSEHDIENFLEEINNAFPNASIGIQDICFVYKGCLPTVESSSGKVRLMSKYLIFDHGREEGLSGLISVSGVKFTEARYVAKEVVDLVFRKLERTPPAALTSATPLYGGKIDLLSDYIKDETQRNSYGLSHENIQHLIYNYGSSYPEVLKHLEKDGDSDEIRSTALIRKAEILYGIREEMSQRLSDVIFHRTDMGLFGIADSESIKNYAEIMAKELNWNKERVDKEINEVKLTLSSYNLNG